MSGRPMSQAQVWEHLTGGSRTDEQIAADGAKLTISLIDKLRNQLTQAERCCQHVIATGRARKDDDAVWRRVDLAARKLLDGMA